MSARNELQYHADEADRISRANEEEALIGFRNWLIRQASELMIGARWLIRLDELGITIEGVASDTLGLLRKIARGQVDPSVVSTFGHNTAAIEAVSTLSIHDQKRLGVDAFVEVAEIQNGEVTIRKLNVRLMKKKELKRVICGGVILTPEQQLQIAESKSPAKSTATIRPNRAENQLTINGKPLDAAEVRIALAGLSRIKEQPNDPEDVANVKIPKELHAILKVAAAERQCSVWEVIWRTCRVSGI